MFLTDSFTSFFSIINTITIIHFAIQFPKILMGDKYRSKLTNYPVSNFYWNIIQQQKHLKEHVGISKQKKHMNKIVMVPWLKITTSVYNNPTKINFPSILVLVYDGSVLNLLLRYHPNLVCMLFQF